MPTSTTAYISQKSYNAIMKNEEFYELAENICQAIQENDSKTMDKVTNIIEKRIENKEFPNDNSINIQNSPIPNNPESEGRGTDLLSDIFKVAEGEYTSLVDKKPKLRYGNASNVRMEIRTGYTKGVSLVAVYIDYLRVP